MNAHYVKFKEIYDVRKIAPVTPWLIEKRGIISHDERFSNKSFLSSSISEFSAGKISINTILSLWDENLWVHSNLATGRKYWIYRLIGDYYRVFDIEGNINTKYGSRKFLIQYMKHQPHINYEWGEADLNLLKELYDKDKSLFGPL